MEELLGVKTDFLFLVAKKGSSSSHKAISWKEAFEPLDMKDLPPFAIEMSNRISTSNIPPLVED
jgi:hypothetical protein